MEAFDKKYIYIDLGGTEQRFIQTQEPETNLLGNGGQNKKLAL